MTEASRSSNRDLLRIVRAIADYQFGGGIGEKLFDDGCIVKISKRTGRPKYVYEGEEVLATVRYPDNLLALTLKGAEKLSMILPRPRFRVVIKPKALNKILKGMNPTARDILNVDEKILPGEEVLIEDLKGELIGVGRAVVSGSLMKDLASGVVVKLRKIRKKH
ncbi:MAG: pseudouridine synthase [Thaumarchaeota archaeon]|nr:pseudouridine synthase [Nitrososphaerota archaeon]